VATTESGRVGPLPDGNVLQAAKQAQPALAGPGGPAEFAEDGEEQA
jgi:hypothetical protein